MRPRRILVVDDEEIVHLALGDALSDGDLIDDGCGRTRRGPCTSRWPRCGASSASTAWPTRRRERHPSASAGAAEPPAHGHGGQDGSEDEREEAQEMRVAARDLAHRLERGAQAIERPPGDGRRRRHAHDRRGRPHGGARGQDRVDRGRLGTTDDDRTGRRRPHAGGDHPGPVGGGGLTPVRAGERGCLVGGIRACRHGQRYHAGGARPPSGLPIIDVVLGRSKANLALARKDLEAIEKAIEVLQCRGRPETVQKK